MTTLTLGDFIFARGEVPESIAFGSAQKLNIHTLVGGARVIDAMGMVPHKPEWSGWFIGPAALPRARRLKRLAEAGQPLPLRWGEFSYSVVIADFSAEFRAGPNLPYRISLEVVRDKSVAAFGNALSGLLQLVAQDLAIVTGNAASIGDPGLISAVASVGSALAAHSLSSGNAVPIPSAIAQVLQPIAVAQAAAAGLNTLASQQLAAVGPLATPDAGVPDPLSQFVTGLAVGAAAANRAVLLAATGQALGRLAGKLTAATGGAGKLTTGSTDLYHLAAATYGDARAWTRIAQANALTDPVIFGITQLEMPAVSAAAVTGVLYG
jgi:hypothetical protein